MNYRITIASPSDPAVRRWLTRRFSLRGASAGLGQYSIPDVAAIKGMAVILRREDEVEIGTVLFEQIAPYEASVHLALTTSGARTELAFKTALWAAKQQGFQKFHFAISSENRAALGLARRLGLLSAAQELAVEGIQGHVVVGEFVA